MKIIKYFIIIIILILFFLLYDMLKINYHTINKPFIDFSFSNVKIGIFKKIYRQLDKNYENALLNFSTHSNYWKAEDDLVRKKLPNEFTLYSKGPFTENKYNYEKNLHNWPRSHGNNNSNRFSDLAIINKNNLENLEIAWIYNSKDRNESKLNFDIQCNPIIVDGKIYTPTAGGYIVSIDGYTGKELWRSKKFKDDVARRGIVYWNGAGSARSRIYFSNYNELVALNADDGKIVQSFGNKNKGAVRTGISKITPLIFNNYIILATWDKTLEVYDLLNGKTKFKISFKDEKDERNGGKKYNNSKGGNPWGGISGDLDRGIVYITTGNPYSYFDGTQRPGVNKYSNSVIAIDIINKKILWDFQEVSHDIWNSDLPAPPILTSIKKRDKIVDVVVVPTKRGNTLILDRLTGESLFDLRYRKAPISLLPGEKTSPYQLDLKIPEPFARNIFSYDEISKLSDETTLYIKNIVKDYKYGFFETHEVGKKNLQYNFHGGAEWMGGSVDHDKNILYLNANNIAEITSIVKDKENNNYISIFERLFDQNGYPGTTPPWGTVTALNLNSGKIIWSIPFGSYPELEKKGIPKTGTENFGGVTATKGELVFATGTIDKRIYAFDALNGNELWSRVLPFIGSAPPSAYIANGEQFILVQSTGSHSLRGGGGGGGYKNIELGDAIVAFKLRNNVR
jgi:quinoprotein glucose dehydrogenase